VAIRHCEPQDHRLERVLDRTLIEQARPALERGEAVAITATIRNTDRTVGAMLSGEIAKRYGHEGLPDETVHVTLTGIAGQSFGAFLAHGVTLDLTGEANDYVGKGLSGGKLIVRPPANSGIVPDKLDHRRQHRALRGHRRGMLLPRRGGRALRGAQFRRHRGGRGLRRPRLRIHDRRRRGGDRPDGPQFRRRHVGRHRLCARRGGRLRKRCNLAMVDLAPVPAEEDSLERLHHHGGDMEHHGLVDISADMTAFDAERLWQLIGRHHKLTGSARARMILDRWDRYLPKFVKVMPVEYRRALLELEKAQAESDGMRIGLAKSG
jgi:glutamate synthase (NADPH) large chain